jgi:DNA polymerase V
MWLNNDIEDKVEGTDVSEHTGFPNAGTDSSLTSLNLGKLLIKNPASTFFMRVRGQAWQTQGIFDNDVVVIDRALSPKPNDLVVWWVADSFVFGNLGQLPEDAALWGVVSSTIHFYRNLG